MKSIAHYLIAGLAGCSILASHAMAEPETPAEKLGWKLGVQAYTFRALTLFETVDKVHELGLKYIEMYPGQKLKPDSDVKSGLGMSQSDIAELKAKLKADNVKLFSFGVAPIPTNEPEASQYFEWAKNLGLEVLVTETTPTEMMDKLTGEFGIKIAIHNHPTTWPPEEVLAATKDFSPRIGSCADVGHWSRAGLDTVATLKELGSRVIHLHLKDVAPVKNPKAGDTLYQKIPDVPWGTGESNVRGMLAELKSGGFKGCMMIEYETGTVDELMQNIPKCIQFYNQTALDLGK